LRGELNAVRAEPVEASLCIVCQPSFDKLGTNGGGEAALCFVEPRFCRHDLGFAIARRLRPYRCHQEQLVGQPVKNQYHRRPDKQHVGQIQFRLGGSRQFFHQTYGFIAKIADQTGEGARQFSRNLHPAVIDQPAERCQAIPACRREILLVVEPVAIDRGLPAISAKHEIRG